jgi:ribonuclease HI
MVTLTSAENALKTLYLGVVTEQFNTNVNPFLTKIQQTTSDVWGKNVVKVAEYGLNGGVGAGSETGTLPIANGNNYAQFTSSLKNLYGTIEISDKAMLASGNSAGAFVNLLNAEMEGLLKASKFNLGRMLYGDGSGKLANCITKSDSSANTVIKLDNLKNVMEGMTIDIYDALDTTVTFASGKRILSIDRANSTITVDGTLSSAVTTGYFITMQKSYNLELTGLAAIFNNPTLYGLSKSSYQWLNPYQKNLSAAISIGAIQEALDNADELAGSNIDFIITSYAVKRAYLNHLNLNRRNIDYLNLDGGFKALSYNGIPVISDRFIDDNSMYLLNSKDFKLHQLCDWRWIEGDNGNIIRQKAGSASYSATLVKYAELICDKPIGQALIKNITLS